jgi:hypothetical protein
VPEIAAIAVDCRGFMAIPARFGAMPGVWSPPSTGPPSPGVDRRRRSSRSGGPSTVACPETTMTRSRSLSKRPVRRRSLRAIWWRSTRARGSRARTTRRSRPAARAPTWPCAAAGACRPRPRRSARGYLASLSSAGANAGGANGSNRDTSRSQSPTPSKVKPGRASPIVATSAEMSRRRASA